MALGPEVLLAVLQTDRDAASMLENRIDAEVRTWDAAQPVQMYPLPVGTKAKVVQLLIQKYTAAGWNMATVAGPDGSTTLTFQDPNHAKHLQDIAALT